jgi:hypothetical protein
MQVWWQVLVAAGRQREQDHVAQEPVADEVVGLAAFQGIVVG